MKYKVSKPEFDEHHFTSGVVLPDGFYRIFELTMYNSPNVEDLIRRGYQVEEYTGKQHVGIYEEDTDKRVSEESVLAVCDPGTGVDLQYLPDTAKYDDPMETLGMPKSANRGRGGYKAKRSAAIDSKIKSADDIQNVARQQRLRKGIL